MMRWMNVDKLKLKPELIMEFAIDHKTDVHSIVMNDLGDVCVDIG